MLKKLNSLLNIVMGAALGGFIAHSAYLFRDYKTHPSLYEMRSAPWYTSILVYGVFTCAVLLVAAVLKAIIRKKLW